MKPKRTALHIGALCIAATVLVIALVPSVASAQQVPPRGYQLQQYRMISPEPLSNADRVRHDVIRATNPVSGRVDVRVLQTPDVTGPAWGGRGRGSVGQIPTPGVEGPPWGGRGRGSAGQISAPDRAGPSLSR
ncbi:MAG TPA: hypothetical protein VK463_11035 [Desulfomonilaceae bacterium]|nr:hypothetical protein [Desulfomonilaceae bacterium]